MYAIALPDPVAVASALATQLARAAERELIRESGLLTLSIPVRFGGQGAAWPTVYQVIRILAVADRALAHLFGLHHLQLAGIRQSGSAAQQERLLTATVARRLFWGDACDPPEQRTNGRRRRYRYGTGRRLCLTADACT